MTYREIARASLAGLFVAGCAWAATLAATPQPAVLARIEAGEWEFKETGSSTAALLLCVSDPAVLLKLKHELEHAVASCSESVIADTTDSATVHYTCPGHGYGRTTITIETPRLLRLDTKGTYNGAPFGLDYEGRRVGACSTK